MRNIELMGFVHQLKQMELYTQSTLQSKPGYFYTLCLFIHTMF